MIKEGKEVFRSYDILECLDYKEKREKEGYKVYIFVGVDKLGRYIVVEKEGKNGKEEL